jgi:hypothetical protein
MEFFTFYIHQLKVFIMCPKCEMSRVTFEECGLPKIFAGLKQSQRVLILRTLAFKKKIYFIFPMVPNRCQGKRKEKNEMAFKGGLKTPHPRWRKTPTP